MIAIFICLHRVAGYQIGTARSSLHPSTVETGCLHLGNIAPLAMHDPKITKIQQADVYFP